MNSLSDKLIDWIQEEESLGAPSGFRAVLSSVDQAGSPHGRIVAIREITENNIIFFTQKASRKYHEMHLNSAISLTFWFELKQREVMIDGYVEPLSKEENQQYWNKLPKERQTYFSAYSPTSGQEIATTDEITQKHQELNEKYQNSTVPLSDNYRGFRVLPQRYVFYTLYDDKVSNIHEYTKGKEGWKKRLLSP